VHGRLGGKSSGMIGVRASSDAKFTSARGRVDQPRSSVEAGQGDRVLARDGAYRSVCLTAGAALVRRILGSGSDWPLNRLDPSSLLAERGSPPRLLSACALLAAVNALAYSHSP